MSETSGRLSHNLRLVRFMLDPRNVRTTVQKVVQRRGATAETAAANDWAGAIAIDSDDWLRARDAGLAAEAADVVAAAEADVRESNAEVGVMGGAADCELAYWLVRALRPAVVVETGVAAGWSSRAFLTALEANGAGRLLSSDLPYPGLTDAAAHVGIVVPEKLRDRWRLDLDGDDKNLRRFVRTLVQVDLFHFDSDKSRAGRTRAMRVIEPLLTDESVIVMDDIGDNLWFRDWVDETKIPYDVVRSGNKYVGIASRRSGFELARPSA